MQNNTTKFPLSRKIAIMLLAIALLLCAVLILQSYIHYRSEMYEHYELFASNIGRIAASQIDPDKIEEYLKTGEPDEDYERAFDTLCDIRENGGIMYLYVVKPELDEVWYVLDTDPSEDAIPLGYHEPYYEGDFAENAERMTRGEAIAPIISNEEYGWLMSVYVPMKTSDGQPAGYVGVDILMNDVMDDLHSYALRSSLLIAFLAIVLILISIRFTSRMIAVPIRKLSAAAEQLVEAEQSGGTSETAIFSQLSIRSKDEVGALYQSLSQMETDINAYIRDLVTVTSEKERIGTELALANRIQADMLPNIFPAFPDRTDFDIYASMTPAKEVGGDFYDFFLLDESHLGLVMADVSGKGVPAALFMMISKMMIQNFAMTGRSPATVLEKVNEQICANNREEMFVTVWLGILDLSTGHLTASNAGHEYPVLRRPNGRFEIVKDKHGFVIGGMDGVHYKEYSLQMDPGSALFLYTDGVPEATNANNELFGMERAVDALNADPDRNPQELLKGVAEAVAAFVGDAPQFDDLTMLGLVYFGKREGPEMLTFDAVIDNIPVVTDFINERLEAMDCPMKAQMQIDVAVDEIFANIANYAYPNGTGSATVKFEATEDPHGVRITFIDRGIPFNPLEKEDPDTTLSAEERQIGGLGIFMVKKSMDDVLYSYEDGQNILTIIKRF